jgi:hypothetical protein
MSGFGFAALVVIIAFWTRTLILTVSDPASDSEPDCGLDHDVERLVVLMRRIVLN